MSAETTTATAARIARKDLLHPLLLRLDHGGMDDRIQFFAGARLRRRVPPAVADSIGRRHRRPPVRRRARSRRRRGCPGSISARPSSSDSMTSAPSSRRSRATVLLPLPRPPVRPTRSIAYKPRRIFAARTVLAISMAMVSGPTPPGTGVYAPAFSKGFGMRRRRRWWSRALQMRLRVLRRQRKSGRTPRG